MRNLLICSFLGAVLLYVLLHDTGAKKKRTLVRLPGNPGIVLNPLDAILGEKKRDDGTFRDSNFDSILRIKASFLRDSSVLYQVQQLTEKVFLLTRKKFFYNNRGYSLFVKTQGDTIVSCCPVLDFQVRKALYSDRRIYFIADDYSEIASPWKPTYTVKIACLNLDFQEQWKTSSQSNNGYFFYGTGLEKKQETLIAGIVVQPEGSSTMCTGNYILKLKMSGEILPDMGAYTGGYGCGPELSSTELPLLFRHEHQAIRSSF